MLICPTSHALTIAATHLAGLGHLSVCFPLATNNRFILPEIFLLELLDDDEFSVMFRAFLSTAEVGHMV